MKEFDFIHFIQENFQNGIGDDCSVVPIDENKSYLVSTDTLVEKVHFLLDKISVDDLAYKALAVNLSDLAAMGAKPHSFYLSLCVPKHFSSDSLLNFMRALKKYADEFSINLLGGNTTKSESDLVISITIVGESENKNIRYRKGAKPGDFLCVTGALGSSRGGLELIHQGEVDHPLIRAHYRPPFRLEEAQFLAASKSVHSMMDISDGLAGDLLRLKEASHQGIFLDLEKIPTTQELKDFCREKKKNLHLFAYQGGEDYELLFSVKAEDMLSLQKEYGEKFKKDFFVIGKVVDLKEDNLKNFAAEGFDHFNQKINPPTCLTIAGSDSGGGAGIQADLKTFHSLETYGMSVITALTAQNTREVRSIVNSPPQFVADQLNVIFEDFSVDAVKIGMLSEVEIIERVVDALGRFAPPIVVLDPVMVSKSKNLLLNPLAIDKLKNALIPLATLITPNIPEVTALLGWEILERNDFLRAAHELQKMKVKNVLIKGGHFAENDDLTYDFLLTESGEEFWFERQRIFTKNTHGTGCTYSSAITAYLAKKCSLPLAIKRARDYLQGNIIKAKDLSLGKGYGPLLHSKII